MITVDSTTATTITISGGVPSDSVADSYVVTWQTGGNGMKSTTINDDSISSYDITGLEEDSTYFITVISSNSAGSSAVSSPVSARTMEAGKKNPLELCSV